MTGLADAVQSGEGRRFLAELNFFSVFLYGLAGGVVQIVEEYCFGN